MYGKTRGHFGLMRYTKQSGRRPASVPTTCRLQVETLVRVEIAAQLSGLTRSQYMARAVSEHAERDLARCTVGGAGRENALDHDGRCKGDK